MLSAHPLTNAQEAVLKKGSKFSVASRKLSVLDIISGVEFGLSQVSFDKKCFVECSRSKVVKVLKRAKLPKPNISKEKKRAIDELKQRDDIVILNADKGNSTVVMNKKEYNQKLENMLSDTAIY